jgi:hypothetical protein
MTIIKSNKNTNNTFSENLENFLVLTFCALVFVSGISYTTWGYDEYAAVVSHVELDDPRFFEAYQRVLSDFGFHKWIIDHILMPLLSILIVPIRWTYAIGISPSYMIARLEIFTWEQVKAILTFFHVATIFFGLRLIKISLSPTYFRLCFVSLLLTLALLSHSFIYWMTTFTSYSLHVLCFGTLIFVEYRKSIWSSKMIGGASVGRSLIALCNYQYFPVLFCMGCYELFTRRKKFFIEKDYINWILPGIICLASISIIQVRLSLIGAEVSPQLNFPNAERYVVPNISNLTSLVDIFNFLISRLIDVGHYFFFTSGHEEYFGSGNFTRSPSMTSLVTLFFGTLWLLSVGRLIRAHNSEFLKVFAISALIIFIQILFYVFNVAPASPTRHGLIIFLPLMTMFSISVIVTLKKLRIKGEHFSGVAVLLLCCSCFGYYLNFDDSQTKIDSSPSVFCALQSNVNAIVLEQCYFEPVLENKKTSLIYSCGSFVKENIADNAEHAAIIASREFSASESKSLLLKYSNDDWKRSFNLEKNIHTCRLKIQLGKNHKHAKIYAFEQMTSLDNYR